MLRLPQIPTEYNVDLARELLGRIPDVMVISGLQAKLTAIIQSYQFEVNKHHATMKVHQEPRQNTKHTALY